MSYNPNNPNGQATKANSAPVVIASDQDIATSANQTSANTKLDQIHADLIAALPAGTNVIGAVTQSGTWTIQPGNTANTVPWKVDGSGVTQPVSGTFWQATQPISAAALPLPTGAATAAKQPALGVAGTPSTDVLTVQGAASMTALKVDGSATTQPVSGTVTANAGTGSFTVAQATASNLNANVSGTVTVQQSTAANLKVDLSGTAANATALKVDGSAVTQPISGSLTNISGTISLPTGAATSANQTTLGSSTTKINDGTNTAAVKAASTAAAATDPALVVAVSPNNTVPVSQKASTSASITLQSAAAATGNGTVLTVDGYSAVILTVSGTFVGTVTFEGTEDGTNYSALSALQLGTNTIATSTTTTGLFEVTVAGLVNVRARVSAYTSGNITVTGHAVPVPYAPKVTSESRLPSALGQAAAASSLPVTLSNENVQDLYVTGQSAQTATVNNILTATSGTAATDVQQYRSFAIQVVSTGTGGTFIFEGSNDNSNFQTVPVFNQALATATPITAAITPTASQIIYVGSCSFRYIRLRIATTITGGSIQAFSTFTQTPYGNPVMSVAQPTAANLAVTASIAATQTLSTVTTVGTVTTLSQFAASAAAADGTANPTTTIARDAVHLYNGTTWDRQYNNINGTTGDTGTKTTSFTGATQTNFNARGAYITVLCGTVSGTTPTLNAQLQFSPDAGTTWINIGAASGNATATANTILFQVAPLNWTVAGATPAALTTGATATVQLNAQLPRTWRLNYTIGGTTPSFAITAVYVNYLL